MPDLKLKRWSDRDVEIDHVLAFNYPIIQLNKTNAALLIVFIFNIMSYIYSIIGDMTDGR